LIGFVSAIRSFSLEGVVMWVVEAIGVWVIASLIGTPLIGLFMSGKHPFRNAKLLAFSDPKSSVAPAWREMRPVGLDWAQESMAEATVESFKRPGYAAR
jgi:hypothetical protein